MQGRRASWRSSWRVEPKQASRQMEQVEGQRRNNAALESLAPALDRNGNCCRFHLHFAGRARGHRSGELYAVASRAHWAFPLPPAQARRSQASSALWQPLGTNLLHWSCYMEVTGGSSTTKTDTPKHYYAHEIADPFTTRQRRRYPCCPSCPSPDTLAPGDSPPVQHHS